MRISRFWFYLVPLILFSANANAAWLYTAHTLSTKQPTVQSACDAFIALYPGQTVQVTLGSIGGLYSAPNKYGTSHKCKRYNQGSLIQTVQVYAYSDESCPTGYEDDGNGNCQLPPECPAGQTNLGNGCEDICYSGYSRTYLIKLTDIKEEYIDPIGCITHWDGNTPTCRLSDPMVCSVTYIDSGVWGGTATGQPDEQPEPTEPEVSETESSETYEKTPPVTQPVTDGTQTTTTETTTINNDFGDTVTSDSSNVTHSNSTGEQTEVVKETQTTIYNDGTATEQITTTTTATPNTSTITSVNVNTGEVTETVILTGETGQVIDVVTNTYDTNGTLTNSVKSQTGSINPAGQNGNGEGGGGEPSFCEYAQVVCDFIDWVKGEGTQEPEHPELPVEEIDVTTLQSDYTSGIGSGSCPSDTTFSLQGQSGSISNEPLCTAASTVFRPILLLLGAIGAGFILAGFRR